MVIRKLVSLVLFKYTLYLDIHIRGSRKFSVLLPVHNLRASESQVLLGRFHCKYEDLKSNKHGISLGLGFVVRGESPGCRLISTASMLEWLRNLLPHHSQGSSTERWSRNTLRVFTARVFYVLWGFLSSPFILNNSVETAAPFNVVIHPRCSEPRN